MDIEVCVASIATAMAASRQGAKRVELCSALDLGGLTPGLGLVEACLESCDLEVHAMIRPRAGHFTYSPEEGDVMLREVQHVGAIGAHGVVFGCLDSAMYPDMPLCLRLLEEARKWDMEVTFHRAFDFCTNPERALETIVDMGFDRILTSGQAPTAVLGKQNIKRWVQQTAGRIEWMAGSGVSPSNARELAESGVDALHFTARKKQSFTGEKYNMGAVYIPDEDKIVKIRHAIKKFL